MACWLWILFGILGTTWNVKCDDETKYDNYTLIRIFPTNNVNLEDLKKFNDPENQVEVLKQTRGYNSSLDVLVPPDRLEFVEDFAKSKDMLLEMKQKNYGRTFEDQDRIPRRRVLHGNPAFQYSSFSAIQGFVESTAKRHPEFVTLQPVGKSYEGRPLTLVKISSDQHAQNPIIFIDAGVHAREWVAPAMAIYLIDRLTNDVEARKRELNGVDWYILPLVNPDGYEYTRNGRRQRMWRKTRSVTADGCFGVDGNRNYGFKWAVSGVSNDPCNAETYAGPRPFSEPETKAVRNIMMSYQNRVKLYVSLHAYGQYLVYPWGYSGDYLPKTWKKLDALARKVSLAVSSAGGKPFHVMSAGQWYPAAGASDDYAFGAVGVPYSYTMELTDDHEFIFPERLLKEVLPQFYEGFKVFAAHIKREFSNRDRAARTAGLDD